MRWFGQYVTFCSKAPGGSRHQHQSELLLGLPPMDSGRWPCGKSWHSWLTDNTSMLPIITIPQYSQLLYKPYIPSSITTMLPLHLPSARVISCPIILFVHSIHLVIGGQIVGRICKTSSTMVIPDSEWLCLQSARPKQPR